MKLWGEVWSVSYLGHALSISLHAALAAHLAPRFCSSRTRLIPFEVLPFELLVAELSLFKGGCPLDDCPPAHVIPSVQLLALKDAKAEELVAAPDCYVKGKDLLVPSVEAEERGTTR